MNTPDIMNKCISQKDSDQFHRSESFAFFLFNMYIPRIIIVKLRQDIRIHHPEHLIKIIRQIIGA